MGQPRELVLAQVIAGKVDVGEAAPSAPRSASDEGSDRGGQPASEMRRRPAGCVARRALIYTPIALAASAVGSAPLDVIASWNSRSAFTSLLPFIARKRVRMSRISSIPVR